VADFFALKTSIHVLSLAIAVVPDIAIVVVNFPDGMTRKLLRVISSIQHNKQSGK
jgi:hypothetical protein